MTASGKYSEIKAVLASVLAGGEAEAAAGILMEDIAGFDRRKLFTDGGRTLLDVTERRLDEAVARILAGEPVQYAVGRARFHGMDFVVSPAVLIPRPETEGLVDLVVDRFGGRSDLCGLDACTGSGCIAVALARNLPFSRIEAFDISDGAISVARMNGRALAPKVDFFKADALNLPPAVSARYDFIVSNPPYVLPSEAAEMDARVLEHEPRLALFADAKNPLEFYEALADYSLGALKHGGMLFFEINQTQGAAMNLMLEAKGFDSGGIEILKDYKGNVRYAVARK